MAAVVRGKAEGAVLAAMARWSEKPMAWGIDDCMLAVADVVREITGKDPAKPFRGRYRTRRGALRVMGRGGTLKAARAAARRLGWKRIDPMHAQVGDVGLVAVFARSRSGKKLTAYSAVVCRSASKLCSDGKTAPGWFVARNERGFTALSSDKISKAWSIG